MAINLANKYPGRANPESVDYPSGSFKNRTTPDSKDGMILEQGWANDFLGARDAILSEAGIVADGEVETAQKSQVLEALNILYKVISTTDVAGIIQLATAAEAKALTNGVKAITPATLKAAFDDALGTAATRDVTTSNYDGQANRVSRPGNFGIGSRQSIAPLGSENYSGIYANLSDGTLDGLPAGFFGIRPPANLSRWLAFSASGYDLKYISSSGGSVDLFHSGNLDPSEYAQKSANLGDLSSPATARTNLGLGNSATRDVGTTSGTVAAGNDSRIAGAAQKSANLGDLSSPATARTNLGLGNNAAGRANLGLGSASTLTAEQVVRTDVQSRIFHSGTPLLRAIRSGSDINAAIEIGGESASSRIYFGTGSSGGGLKVGTDPNLQSTGHYIWHEGNLSPFGVNQNWTSPTRSLSTNYTNTSGRPIFISVASASITSTPASLTISVEGEPITTSEVGGANFSKVVTVQAVIPVGAVYRVTGSEIQFWREFV